MQTNAHRADLERRRAELLRRAAGLVQLAASTGRELTADEDALVLELSRNAHAIEEEILRLERHHQE